MINYIPEWLKPLLGNRERDIITAADATTSNSDCDGEWLPKHQQRIISKANGEFTIDSKRRMIIN